MRTIAIAFSILALVAAGCGDDDEDAGGSTPTPAAPNGGGGSTVGVAADPGGELAYEPTTLTAEAGSVTIDFANESQLPHDVVIEQDGNDVGATDEITNSTTETTVDLEAGTYTFYCSVPGHREAGMEGALTVE